MVINEKKFQYWKVIIINLLQTNLRGMNLDSIIVPGGSFRSESSL